MKQRVNHHVARVQPLRHLGPTAICIAGLFILTAALPILIYAQGGYDLSWWTVDGGGGTNSAGDYTLSSTTGQPDARELSGDVYTLEGGFWAGVAEPVLPVLNISKTDAPDPVAAVERGRPRPPAAWPGGWSSLGLGASALVAGLVLAGRKRIPGWSSGGQR